MEDMAPEEAREFIRHNKFGILGLADNGRSYALPLFYGYDGKDIYFQTQPGLKQRYAVATEEACFTIVRVVTLDQWASVQVFGDLTRIDEEADAQRALMSIPLPPTEGTTKFGEPKRTAKNVVVYKLTARRMSGRYSQSAPMTREEREIAFGGM